MIPDDERIMPETRPDSEAAAHRALCQCDVCRRPGSMTLKKRFMRHQIRMRSWVS